VKFSKEAAATVHPFRVKRNAADHGGPAKPPRSLEIVGVANGISYTNIHSLPPAYVRAALNDQYDKGLSDFSATGLAQLPRATALIEQYRGMPELVVDVSSRVASIIGKGSHTTAECAARPGIDLCEVRMFARFEVDGKIYIVSAQLDLYETDTKRLLDWKTTKAYAFSKKAGGGRKDEWIAQLNVGAEILRRNGHHPKTLTIIAMLKDWNEREAGKSHPDSEVMSVDLPMWTSERATAYVEDRIRLHVAARTNLPECTSKETWGGRKCPKWCDAKSVCSQFKQMQRTGLVQSEE
jgi:hypothetical protein